MKTALDTMTQYFEIWSQNTPLLTFTMGSALAIKVNPKIWLLHLNKQKQRDSESNVRYKTLLPQYTILCNGLSFNPLR